MAHLYRLRFAGFIARTFEFYLTKGEHTVTLEAVREPVGIGKISFIPVVNLPTYEEYLVPPAAGYKQVICGADQD